MRNLSTAAADLAQRNAKRAPGRRDVEHLYRRRGHWYFCRRVPTEFEAFDGRGIVRQTTKVRIADDPRGLRAGAVAARFNAELEAYWLGLVQGQAADAQRRYDDARRRARQFGLEYIQAAQLATSPLPELLGRLERLIEKRAIDDPQAVAGALGGVPAPPVRLSALFELYEAMVRTELEGLSEEQLHRWRLPKKRAIVNLTSVVGDKPANQLTRADALDFREHLESRVLDGEIEIATANKDIGHVSRMLKIVNRRLRLELDPVFADLRLEGGKENSRAAFTAQFVQERILIEGALTQLNIEARCVIYLMAETGLRPSEAVNLNQSTIVLIADIPHVRVRPDGRRLKTDQSARDIPLVGVALQAMREQPTGFPRYVGKADTLSAVINKFLGSRGLRPTENHSLYSLRHTFKDRLREVDCPDELVDELMGHKIDKPKYGAGSSLRRKLEWLEKIAFRSPRAI